MSTTGKRSFVPALGFDWLTSAYEPLMRIYQPVRRQLIDQADIQPGMTVLDFGCGPGQLALLAKQAYPDARIIATDVDPKMERIARSRLRSADIEFRLETLEELALAPGSIDRILTGFVLHHLTTDQKLSALKVMYGLLHPEGRLHILDLGKPRGMVAKLSSYGHRLSHGRGVLDANLDGRIPHIAA
ncbi:class I SAM-dependent methyltransferase [Nocardia transvalensis]|uniref:class I SAM-dependent methyltransferase n=1 Tax=Nocardia transvalensis TaxID=37333 RepID=UPI00189322C9|nr:class I SAM-dependent methyltransferase [Nocardia transvalensis]MBF6332974.1 methyltransferase domain-containing protein [Nocardia transvalensis]